MSRLMSRDWFDDISGALVSRRALMDREPVSEYAMVSGRALVAYADLLRRMRAAARVLPRGDMRRRAIAAETWEVRQARRRSSYARRALMAPAAGDVE